ncbi:MAG: riboflavin synthase [Planctomycetes bacterium]|nr:riboflavin synthase [Planctomycetota bacterium]
MFTGLIKSLGKVASVSPKGNGITLAVDISGLGYSPEIGASIAICGTCLTVTALSGKVATFDAVTETVRRSLIGSLKAGDTVNLEPALRAGDPLDGHIVSGHVDAACTVTDIRQLPESWVFRFSLPDELRHLVATKGSVAIDGISLTVAEAGRDWFTVSVIPHTYEKTNLHLKKVGSKVNLEVDMLARYAARRAEVEGGGLTESFLRENGFG